MQVDLIDHLGDDLRVVNSARVSFGKESEWEWHNFDTEEEAIESGELINYDYIWSDNWMGGYPTKTLSQKDQKLINYLAKHNHWTPFSHVQITMREKVPIFVARQRFKHMVGFTYNEVSRRYVDEAPEFFVPDVWRGRAENKKQGSSNEKVDYLVYGDWYEGALKTCENVYTNLLLNGVAPEQARMVLPQSMYTEYYVTGSLAAWARAYKLRSDPHAQKEIQDLAIMWDEKIGSIEELKYSWKALTE